MNYAKIRAVDVANGVGVRTSLFVSGCNHHCEGCFNAETWDFNYGKEFREEHKKIIIDLMKDNWISGLSVLGGEPLQQDKTLLDLLKTVKKVYPNKTIWLYTGYTYEEVKEREELNYIDVLVDGKFEIERKNINLQFRGSENQRIIDVKRTKEKGEIVLWSR